MTTNGNEPAFACAGAEENENGVRFPFVHFGLSKRELFAAMAMQGLLARPEPNAYTKFDDAAFDACAFADALIIALSEEPQS